MPFCSQCGNQLTAADRFCGRCGGRQPVGAAPSSARTADPLSGISPRTASVLCYVPGLGWIGSIVALASQRFRHDRAVRFHAFQGLYLFVAWLLDDWVLRPMLWRVSSLHHIVQAVLLGMSIFMMVKAAHDETYELPLFGELAQRSMAEE